MKKCEENLADSLFTAVSQAREKRNLTYQQISDASGVSLSTVSRFFSGQSESVSMVNYSSIAAACGVSLLDLSPEPDPRPPVPAQQVDQMRGQYEAIIRDKNGWLRALAAALAVLVLFILILFAVDILNPHVGWVRETPGEIKYPLDKACMWL